MLELLNIKKDYVLKGQEPVHALKGISLKFRKNEFVAILGPSGCGKTTLLNITGGLDHYDDGDLIIKDKSTKDFKDADWDTYRNHSIGFVFQTYNLIPHQTILKNVELALTISGISKAERRARAKNALDKVGLAGLYRKKPNQMSGGQMQRVAIARALVNSPEIVLADEPTGALDSETSVQIMDLLKEVAKTHLVIMVTHNPELAELYATRIVRMKDGNIIDDSDPFDGKDLLLEEASEDVPVVNKGKKKHSSMSFITAFALSMSNLFSKMKRTILVSLAGSIGIIGVSTILGVSCGVNNFIDNMQNDMLSAYPIGVAEESIDLNSLITGLTTQDKKQIAKFDLKTQVGMDSMITYLLTKYTDFTNIKTNDINENFVAYMNAMPKSNYAAMNFNYSIDPTNNFLTEFYKKEGGPKQIISLNGLTQQYIKTLMTVKGFSEYAQFVDLFANFMKQLPAEKGYLSSQYDLLPGSRYPTAENELLLVVDKEQTMTDLVLAQLGYYPQDEFLNVAKRAVKLNELRKEYEDPDSHMTKEEYKERRQQIIDKYQYNSKFNISDILNHEFYYLPHDDLYSRGSKLVSHKQIQLNMKGELASGGDYYLSLDYGAEADSLTGKSFSIVGDEAKMHTIVATRMSKAVRGDDDHSELNGTWAYIYYDELTTEKIELLSELQSIDFTNPMALYIFVSQHPEILEFVHLLNIDSTAEPDTPEGAKKINFDGTASITTLLAQPYVNDATGKIVETEPTTPDFSYNAVVDITDPKYADSLTNVKVVGILKPKESTNFGTLDRGVYFTKAFTEKYIADAQASDIYEQFADHIDKMRYNESTFNAYVEFKYDDYHKDPGDDTPFTPTEVDGYSSALNGDQASTLSSIFASFLNMGDDNLKTDKLHMRALAGMKIVDVVADDDSGDITGHLIKKLPQSISIYPKDFDSKDKVTKYLDRWNSNKTLKIPGIPEPVKREERKEISYTDTISMIVNVISTLVTTVSIALIAFTSLSLVVSCFMIAVITYISVMERVKEIGVIRSLGGRKRDVSTLFISENLITGFASGAIGIIVTYILQAIINAIVSPFGVKNICALPFVYALIMIGISIVLSIISGLIPSLSASKQDPVVALRTE